MPTRGEHPWVLTGPAGPGPAGTVPVRDLVLDGPGWTVQPGPDHKLFHKILLQKLIILRYVSYHQN